MDNGVTGRVPGYFFRGWFNDISSDPCDMGYDKSERCRDKQYFEWSSYDRTITYHHSFVTGGRCN